MTITVRAGGEEFGAVDLPWELTSGEYSYVQQAPESGGVEKWMLTVGSRIVGFSSYIGQWFSLHGCPNLRLNGNYTLAGYDNNVPSNRQTLYLMRDVAA